MEINNPKYHLKHLQVVQNLKTINKEEDQAKISNLMGNLQIIITILKDQKEIKIIFPNKMYK
jgi:hypothetical protein